MLVCRRVGASVFREGCVRRIMGGECVRRPFPSISIHQYQHPRQYQLSVSRAAAGVRKRKGKGSEEDAGAGAERHVGAPRGTGGGTHGGTRFTCREIDLSVATKDQGKLATLEGVISELQRHPECLSVRYGIVILSSRGRDKIGGKEEGDGQDDILIPITDGKVQAHLATALPRNTGNTSTGASVHVGEGRVAAAGAGADASAVYSNFKVHVCAFNARAQVVGGEGPSSALQYDQRQRVVERASARRSIFHHCGEEEEEEGEQEDEEEEEERRDAKTRCRLPPLVASADKSCQTLLRKLNHSPLDCDPVAGAGAGAEAELTTSMRRVVDREREGALNVKLEALHIDYADLLPPDGKYVGTAPSRIYRSFVYPRPYRRQVQEFTHFAKAVALVAAQIDTSLRQVRADNAVYLRNVDRMGVLKRPQSAHAGVENTGSEETAAAAGRSRSGSESGSENVLPARQVASVSAPAPAPAPALHSIALVLDSVRSAFNVGSLFRTSDTAGVAELITTGITCKPPHPKLLKTAMQSIDHVNHRHFGDIVSCVKALKEEGYQIVAMETTAKSKHYMKVEYPPKTALICGNEITGVDVRVLELADMIVEIPTYGVKNSLNVAAAVPVVLFAIVQQMRDKGIP